MKKPINDRRSARRRQTLGQRRRYPRVRVRLDGFYHSPRRDLFIGGGDLNLRGAFVPTPAPDQAGTRAELRLGLPGSPTLLRIGAQVVWSNDQPGRGPLGMGLKFEPLEPWQLKRIAASLLGTGGVDALPRLGLLLGR